MDLPKYKPELWVIYKDENAHLIGQIVGGRHYPTAGSGPEGWYYEVKLDAVGGNASVSEADIVAKQGDNGIWTPTTSNSDVKPRKPTVSW